MNTSKKHQGPVTNNKLTFFAPENFPLVEVDQALLPIIKQVLSQNQFALEDQDVIILAQKIVSKAENRYIDLNTVTPSKRAHELALICQKDPRLVEVILAESQALIRCKPGVIIVRHRLGFIHANAGVDHSNIAHSAAGDRVLLLPENPDRSAQRLRQEIRQTMHRDVAIIINDSFGRPWRIGTSGVCIGCAGIKPLLDHRGETDLFGQSLQNTEVAIGDEIAAAASLLMGQTNEGRPLVVARGLTLPTGDAPATSLIRSEKEDLFL